MYKNILFNTLLLFICYKYPKVHGLLLNLVLLDILIHNPILIPYFLL